MQHDVQELCRKLIDNIEERMKGHPDVEGAVQKLKKFENVVNYVTILDCNYRENDFFFVQTYFIVFSVITAFKINPNTVTNFSKLCQLTFAQCVRLFLYIFQVQFSSGTRSKMNHGMKVVLKKGNDDEHAIRLENQAEEMLQATTLQHIQDNVSSWGGSEVPSWNDNEEDEDQTATPWLDEKQNNQKNVKNDTFSSSGK